MLTIREGANPNYLAKIVRLKGLRKHGNADRLQCVDIDFQTVITGLDAKEGAIYVYFPVESKINLEFLAHTNSFARYDLNKVYLDSGSLNQKFLDDTVNRSARTVGFFGEKGRVKAIRLRSEKSMGYIVPISVIKDYFGAFNEDDYINVEFDTINDILAVEKFEVVKRNSGMARQGKQPKVSRIIEGQVHLHKDTAKLEPNIWKISPHHTIAITNKTHGTSWWVSNVKVKKQLTWKQKLAKFFGAEVHDTEYDFVYGSRNVVKNKGFDDPKQQDHYYGYDLWEDIKDTVKEHIPKGFTLYGEALGFTKDGSAIQKGYDYGCEPKEMKLEIYRITQTNDDGFVTELSHGQITEFCLKTGLTQSGEFHYGKAYWILPDVDANDPEWHNKFIAKLRADYNEKDCGRCVNEVPEEGVVLRVDDLFEFVAFKLKSFRFLEWESSSLDKGEVADIEGREPKVILSKEWVGDEEPIEEIKRGEWVDSTEFSDYAAGIDPIDKNEEDGSK